MENVGLDKAKFEKFMEELVIMYSPISKEKAKLYYETFDKLNISIEQLEKAKLNVFKSKTTIWFPTVAEIINAVNPKDDDKYSVPYASKDIAKYLTY